MQLEQTLGRYQLMQTQRTQERERVYTILNLESLSASALYSESRKIIERKGTVETIIPKFINDDTVKFYYNPLTGKTDVAYQNGGEKHSNFAGSGRMINIDKGSRS